MLPTKENCRELDNRELSATFLHHNTMLHWEFSHSIQERIPEFLERLRQQNVESTITRQWQYLHNVDFLDSIDKTLNEVLNETSEAPCDTDALFIAAIEAIKSGSEIDEVTFKVMSKNQMVRFFTKVKETLTDSDFSNFCKIISKWENVKLLNVCFDCVIYQKLSEKEEASLTAINAVKEVGRNKPDLLSKWIINLLTDKERNFSDSELFEHVLDVFPDNLNDDVTRAIIEKEIFHDSNWQLLQVLAFKTSNSLESIVNFMNSKCEEFAYNQTFARLLVHICKNLQSDKHKEVLMNVIDKNQCLLKHQAKKYLMGI